MTQNLELSVGNPVRWQGMSVVMSRSLKKALEDGKVPPIPPEPLAEARSFFKMAIDATAGGKVNGLDLVLVYALAVEVVRPTMRGRLRVTKEDIDREIIGHHELVERLSSPAMLTREDMDQLVLLQEAFSRLKRKAATTPRFS